MNYTIYTVIYDNCFERVFQDVSQDHLEKVKGYLVKKPIPKTIYNLKEKNILREWELDWNDFFYQKNIFCEYSFFPHAYKNHLFGSEYIGLYHSDVKFTDYFFDEIERADGKTIFLPESTFCKNESFWYFNEKETASICEYMSNKMNMNIKFDNIKKYGWPSCCLGTGPSYIFSEFGKFIAENGKEIFDNLFNGKFFIESKYHRICGLIERMWGIYIMNSPLQLKISNSIIHESYLYTQAHWNLKHNDKL